MPAKGTKAKAPLEPEEDDSSAAPPAPLTLSAEDRRRRVENVRALDADLKRVESALLDAQARLPGLVREVQRMRGVVTTNTAPVAGDEAAAASA